MSSSNKFYDKLERTKVKKPSCSCLSIGIFLIIILAVVEVGIFTTIKNLKSNPVEITSFSKITQDDQIGIERLDFSDETVKIVISQGTLCNRLGKEVACQISTDGISLAGKLNMIIPANSTVLIEPFAENDKLRFRVKEFKIGKVNAPKTLSSGVEGALNKAITNDPSTKDVKVKSVETVQAAMIIYARK